MIVAGAGTMGAGIAFVAANAGFAVDVVDPDEGARARARERIAADARRAGTSELAQRINYYAALPAGSEAGLAVEAAPENLEIKRAVFRSLGSELGADTLLASNTSSLSIADIAQGVPAPGRILGLHFFNPPASMQLVEIVRAEHTAGEAIERARAIVRQLGKTGVLVLDTPGFIVNRVARPYYLQAMRAYEAGVAPMQDLDRLARGAGFRMGPFELMDLIGLDVNLATTQSIYERTSLERLAPVDLQGALVSQNRLGRKTNAGFYEYADGPPVRAEAPLEAPVGIDEVERILIVGAGALALELQELLSRRYANVGLWESEDLLDRIPLDTTLVIDVGDGVSDRGTILAELDSLLSPDTVIFADAYATDIDRAAGRMSKPDRLVGFGVLGSLGSQHAIEVVDADCTGDEALTLAQELFESAGKHVVLVGNHAGLFLGRTVGSIVNEAVTLIEEGTAAPEDVDLAMRLGTNYPRGPIEWGREIGGDRIVRILQRLAGAEGSAFAPHRALWVLDVREPVDAGA